jgi:hypothetical protein
MDLTEIKNMIKCNKNEVFVSVQKHTTDYKLKIRSNGETRLTDDIYPLETNKYRMGVYDKLHDLYRQIAANIDKQKLTVNN